VESIVSDATTLIVLGKLNRYDLLENLFTKIYVPRAVLIEVSKKSDGVYEKIASHSLFERKQISNLVLLGFLDGILDAGESEAIVLASEMKIILLIDEKKGRAVAKNMGLEIIGLLGVLILNVKKKYISKEEAVGILKEMQGMNFRVSKRLVESFSAAIG